MRKIIHGKTYDTDDASYMLDLGTALRTTDFLFEIEMRDIPYDGRTGSSADLAGLYRTKTGAWFVVETIRLAGDIPHNDIVVATESFARFCIAHFLDDAARDTVFGKVEAA